MKIKLKKFGFVTLGFVLCYVMMNALANYTNLTFVLYKPGNTVSMSSESSDTEPAEFLPNLPVKNVILFIGDGMGLSHLTAARLHWYGPNGRLNIERMPVTGFIVTHASDDLITDSAAAATALATGYKTSNGSIGVDANGQRRITLLEAAQKAGFATGLITTTDLTDATPAAFASHVASRNMESEIALQLINTKVNVLFGEGAYFYPDSDPRSKRTDDVEPIELAREAGYAYADTKAELGTVSGPYVLGLFDDITTEKKQVEVESPAATPTLAQLTAKALDVLDKNQKGFFLVVEEEGVDSGSHVNREDYFLHYLKKLDDAVKVALDYAARDGQTLVLVTSDHETGGLNIISGSCTGKRFELTWTTVKHTGQPVPLFAFGPQAIKFTGLRDNTEVPKIIAELLCLETFPQFTKDHRASIQSYAGGARK